MSPYDLGRLVTLLDNAVDVPASKSAAVLVYQSEWRKILASELLRLNQPKHAAIRRRIENIAKSRGTPEIRTGYASPADQCSYGLGRWAPTDLRFGAAKVAAGKDAE